MPIIFLSLSTVGGGGHCLVLIFVPNTILVVQYVAAGVLLTESSGSGYRICW